MAKQFVPPSVGCIIKQKRISDEQFRRIFSMVIDEADINVQNTTSTGIK